MAAPSAPLSAQPVVQAAGEAERWSSEEALARKLLVALWKYVNAGVVVEGAVMRTA
ncbi:transposase [Mesorhizobium japonicum MAFF 303099]|uniref:Transposase n=1 Tax=Mesorhizobium japonicum (strain LMG 29417 / CECT 9101 / MAFF 303099) TaxID=266835 RepID=Q98AH6_RHILO|nr:transposase [Mesorhizobium japonicum MAFF 303099]